MFPWAPDPTNESYHFLYVTPMSALPLSPDNINVYSFHGNPPLDANTQSKVTSSPPGMPVGLLACTIRLHAAPHFVNLTKSPPRSRYPYSTNSLFLQESPQTSCIHFFLLNQVITPPLLAAGWSADHNKMTTFTGRWTQGCMTLQTVVIKGLKGSDCSEREETYLTTLSVAKNL
jgi:hypothetical protein